eukprot:CAMPEP_0119321458 /NCGR_PEP_ID=MMETSP1333-20130426/55443_1 /TAXON_ID=418940 /ORGANISM="Scyphosphaera apsteinii, Strain RCC1455" /LENGTH=181 /DNA_ID=CAMNT_0007328433 /DNA_START=124 /DNA_END=666 /DNA_ORIENTATION=+
MRLDSWPQDMITHLIEACGGWQGAAKIAAVSKRWQTSADAWRSTASAVTLCQTADSAALRVLARHCRALRRLELRFCRAITDSSVLNVLHCCPHLQELTLVGSSISTAVITAALTGCQQLEYLNVRGCPIAADSPLRVLHDLQRQGRIHKSFKLLSGAPSRDEIWELVQHLVATTAPSDLT